MLDLLLTRCSAPGFSRSVDIGVRQGRIAYLQERTGEALPQARETIDLDGALVIPGLVEPHIHLDKALLLDRMEGQAETVGEAIARTAILKKAFTPEDIEQRAIKVIRKAVRSGVTAMRCHAEVDTSIGLAGMESMLKLKEQLRDVISLQIVAFPQEGLFHDASATTLMRQAVALGADAVGGITYADRDAGAHLDYVFRLAAEQGLPVDLHADFSDEPSDRMIVEIARRAREYSMEGRVAVGHMTSIASMPPDEAGRIAEEIAASAIHVIALPATDLYLNGRSDPYRVRRGIAPVKLLLGKGVNVVYGSNNIQNAFTPSGTADPLDIGLLLFQTCHMNVGDVELVIEMATVKSAEALGLTSYGLRVGADADFCICGRVDARTLLFERPVREKVYKRGKLVAQADVRRKELLEERRGSIYVGG